MPVYQYVAVDSEGNEKRGQMAADNPETVRSLLRQRDLYLTKVSSRGRSATPSGQSPLFAKRVKLGDLVVMSRQLATLVRAGLPIVESLSSLADQTENPTLADVIQQVRLDVLSGLSLTEAMRLHPKVFNELYIALVEAGETGGTLEQTLEVAAEQFAREADLREQVKTAMAYPTLVVVASCGVVAFMLLFIVPTFARVYKMFGHDLPAITRLLLAISAFSVQWWWVALISLVVGFFGLKKYYATPTGRRRLDALKMRIPLVGKLIRKIALARFCQTWSGMTKGGVPILQALTVSATTAGNAIVSDAVLSASEHIKDGTVLSEALRETHQFPPMVTRMIAAGEQSGNLDEMLDEVTRFYHRDIEYGVQRLAKLLEPIMTVLVGGIVLFVLLALYMPVFTLGTVVKR